MGRRHREDAGDRQGRDRLGFPLRHSPRAPASWLNHRHPSSPITKPMAHWLADATAHETAGRFAEAEALLIQIINAAPDYHPAVHQAAILSYRRKRYSGSDRPVRARAGPWRRTCR